MTHSRQDGQIGLVVLLVTAVLMTVGMGVASQSIVETKTSRQEGESTQTFNAAEQGMEQALRDMQIGTNNITGIPGVTGTYSVATNTTLEDLQVLPGQSANITLQPDAANNSGNFTVSWNNPNAAVIITVLGSTGIKRYAYGQNNADRGTDNFAFLPVTGCPSNCTTPAVNYLTTDKLARIKVVYDSATLSTTISGNNLPAQTYSVQATAQLNGMETRTVQAEKSLAILPSVFDYALFNFAGGLAVSPLSGGEL